MYDGSGLYPSNIVHADFMTQMLSFMKVNKSFVNSLPIAGKEGTVKNFLKSPEFKGTAKLKSGYFKQVIAYCGYIYTNNNYAVTIIVNNYTCPPSRVRMAIEKLLIDLNL